MFFFVENNYCDMLRRIGILAAVLFVMAVGVSGQLKEGDGAYKVTIPVKDKLSMHGIKSHYLLLRRESPDAKYDWVSTDYTYSIGGDVVLWFDHKPVPGEYVLRVDALEQYRDGRGEMKYVWSENYETGWLIIEVPDSASYPYEMPPLVMKYVPIKGLE